MGFEMGVYGPLLNPAFNLLTGPAARSSKYAVMQGP